MMFLDPDPDAVKQTLDAILVPAFVIDATPDGFKLVAINESHETISGMTNQHVSGQTPDTLLSEEDASQVIARYQACLAAGEPIQYSETLDMPHGRINWLTSLIPMQDASGNTTRLLGNAVGFIDTEDGAANQSLVGDMTQLSLLSALPLHMAIEAITKRLDGEAENIDDTLLLRAVKDLCGTALEASRKMRDLFTATAKPTDIVALLKDEKFKDILDKLRD